jgi:ATP-dependent exoDNAse (exonuclease V) beta subunit
VKNLLLDEFQDTSPAQWRVLRPFAESAAATGSFFCVGDVKQAIYGWRGGVAEIFDTLRDELPGLDAESLAQSFRSSPVVIDVVNRVFENLTTNVALDRYRPGVERWSERFHRHSTAKTELGGYCRLAVAPRSQNEPQAVATLRFAAKEIARLAAESPQATIGVLVRRNSAVARLIFELRRLGVEASEEGGNPLTDSPAVQLVLSLLTLADHPGHSIARFHVASSPLGERLKYTDHANDDATWQLARQIRRRLVDDGYGPTLLRWAKLLAPDCDRRDASRLLQLVDLGYAYEPAANSRPADFTTLVESRRVESPSAALVRVMTIHQAKGLQFDIVVLPELDAKFVGQPSELAVGRSSPTGPVELVCRHVAKPTRPVLPKEFQALFENAERQIVEESLCVFYVAMTRAIHALHIIVAPSRENERTIPGTYAGVLRAALADSKPASPESTLFEHGDPAWRRESASEVKTAPRAEIAAVRLAPPVERRVRGLERRSPSGLEGGQKIQLGSLFDRKSAALERGTLVHERLAQIEWLGDLNSLDEPLRRALEKPEIRALFTRPTGDRANCRVYRERPFALRDGNTILSGAIDRLVMFEDSAEIIDFKTDAIPADDPAAVAAKVDFYRPQMEAYRRAVAAMYRLPAARIAARLAFLSPGIVVDV